MIAIVLGLALITNAQHGDTLAAKHGLVEGQKFTFQSIATQNPTENIVVTVGKPTLVKGVKVFDVGSKYKSYTAHEQWGASEKGLHRYYCAHMDGTGVAVDLDPILEVPTNQAKGYKWHWSEPFRGQTMADENGKGPDMKKLITYSNGEILSTDEMLTTPAGKLKTIHVRINRTSEGLGDSVTELWFAFNKGIVKRSENHKDWKRSLLLIK